MADINKYALELEIQLNQEALRTAIADVSDQFVQIEEQISTQLNQALMTVVGNLGTMTVELSKFKGLTEDGLIKPMSMHNELLAEAADRIKSHLDYVQLVKGATSQLNGEVLSGVDTQKQYLSVIKGTETAIRGLSIPKNINDSLVILKGQFGSLVEMSKLTKEEFAALNNSIGADVMASNLEHISEVYTNLSAEAQHYFAEYAKQAVMQFNNMKKEGVALNEHQQTLMKIANTIVTKNKHHKTELDYVVAESGHFLILNKLSAGFGDKIAAGAKLMGEVRKEGEAIVQTLRKWDAPDEFVEANYRLIGSQYALSAAMESTAGMFGISAQEATAATKALVVNGVATKDNIEQSVKLAGTFVQMTRVTGLSVQTQANLARNLKSVGMSLQETSKFVGMTAMAMRTLGLSADDARNHIEGLNSLIEEFGVTLGKEGAENANKMGLALTKMAKDLGIPLKDVNKLTKDLSVVTSNLSLQANIKATDTYAEKMAKVNVLLGNQIRAFPGLSEAIKNNTGLSEAQGFFLRGLGEQFGYTEQQMKLLYMQSSDTAENMAKLNREIEQSAAEAKEAARLNDLYTESMGNFGKQVDAVWNDIKAVVLPLVYAFLNVLTTLLWVIRGVTYAINAILSPIYAFASSTNQAVAGLEIFAGVGETVMFWLRAIGSAFTETIKPITDWFSKVSALNDKMDIFQKIMYGVLVVVKMFFQVLIVGLGGVILWLTVGNRVLALMRLFGIQATITGTQVTAAGASMFSGLITSITAFFARAGTMMVSFARMVGTAARSLAPATPILLALGVAFLGVGLGVYLFANSLKALGENWQAAAATMVALLIFIVILVAVAYAADAAAPALLAIAAVFAAVALVIASVGVVAYLLGAGFKLAAEGVEILARSLTAELAMNMLLAASAILVLAIAVGILAAVALVGAPALMIMAASLLVVGLAIVLAAYGMNWLADGMTRMADGVTAMSEALTTGFLVRLGSLGLAIATLYWSATGLSSLSDNLLNMGSGMKMFSDAIAAISAESLKNFAYDVEEAAVLLGPAMDALAPALEVVKSATSGLILAGFLLSVGGLLLALGAAMIYSTAVNLYNASEMMYDGAIALQYNAILISDAAPLLVRAGFDLIRSVIPLIIGSVLLMIAAYVLLIAGIILVPGALAIYYSANWLYSGATILYEATEILYPAAEWLGLAASLVLSGAIELLIGSIILMGASIILLFAVSVLFYGALGLVGVAATLMIGSLSLVYPTFLFNLVSIGILAGARNLESAANKLSMAGSAFIGASDAFKAAAIAMGGTIDPLTSAIGQLTRSGIIEDLTSFAVRITDPITKIATAFVNLAAGISAYVSAMLELSQHDAEIGGAIARQQEQLSNLSEYANSTKTLTSPVMGNKIAENEVLAQPIGTSRRSAVTYAAKAATPSAAASIKVEKTDINPVVDKLEEVRLLLEDLLPDLARRQRSQLGEWV